MAKQHSRHAAWHPEAYAVYAVHRTTRVLVGEERTFLDAFELAADYLDRRDPRREGMVPSLEIHGRAAGRSETVWRYSADDPAPTYDPIAHWGFATWEGPRRRTA